MSVFWQATKIVLHQVEITIFLISFATLVSSSSAWFPFLFFFMKKLICICVAEKLKNYKVFQFHLVAILVYWYISIGLNYNDDDRKVNKNNIKLILFVKSYSNKKSPQDISFGTNSHSCDTSLILTNLLMRN